MRYEQVTEIRSLTVKLAYIVKKYRTQYTSILDVLSYVVDPDSCNPDLNPAPSSLLPKN
jgi:hypothetical protein